MGAAEASISVPNDTATRPGINPWIIAVTVTLATFMELLDTAIANVALPHIAGGLRSIWQLQNGLAERGGVSSILESKQLRACSNTFDSYWSWRKSVFSADTQCTRRSYPSFSSPYRGSNQSRSLPQQTPKR
jgi:hypothetical protein